MLAGSGEASCAMTVDCTNSKLVPSMRSNVFQHRAVFHGLGEGSERLSLKTNHFGMQDGIAPSLPYTDKRCGNDSLSQHREDFLLKPAEKHSTDIPIHYIPHNELLVSLNSFLMINL